MIEEKQDTFVPMTILELSLQEEEARSLQIRETLAKRRKSVKHAPQEGWTPWNKWRGQV